VPTAPRILARGPWAPEQIAATWRPEPFEPEQSALDAADQALAALRSRGSPSHDGLAARLAHFDAGPDRLALELQPLRWALRLLPDGAQRSLSVLCVVRSSDGRWLAGRRAQWLATWAGRWALGAAGAVELDENPTETMRRELLEEWSVAPASLQVEALVLLPSEMVLLVGQARLAPGAEVVPDREHDDFAWWPEAVADWPAQADDTLRRMATMMLAS
jgi:8-oxo-dGTP diphosphatase